MLWSCMNMTEWLTIIWYPLTVWLSTMPSLNSTYFRLSLIVGSSWQQLVSAACNITFNTWSLHFSWSGFANEELVFFEPHVSRATSECKRWRRTLRPTTSRTLLLRLPGKSKSCGLAIWTCLSSQAACGMISEGITTCSFIANLETIFTTWMRSGESMHWCCCCCSLRIWKTICTEVSAAKETWQ